MSFRVVTIPESITSHVRAHHRDPVYKHPAHTETARSYGPCRQCLQFFGVGVENRTLFNYDTFLGLDDQRQPGPVFIHEQECFSYSTPGLFPAHLIDHSLTFEGYGQGRKFLLSETVHKGAAEPVIERFFSHADLDYIIVRDTDAGCFDCAIVRD